MNFYEEDLFGSSPYEKQKWSENEDMRQAKLRVSTAGKSVSELKKMVEECESQMPTLTEQQQNIIQCWSAAVGRIKEKPFVESYMLRCGQRELLEYAESYFSNATGPLIMTAIQKRYYYEEKLEVLQNVIEHGPDYLQKYQEMKESIRAYIEKESKSSVWGRWDNAYVAGKMIRWLSQWKKMHLS